MVTFHISSPQTLERQTLIFLLFFQTSKAVLKTCFLMRIYQIFTFAPIVEQHAGSVTGRWPWRPPLSVDTSSARVSKIFIWGPALLLRRTWVFGAGIWDHAIWTVNLYGRVWFVEVGGPQRVAGTRTHRAMHQWGPTHTHAHAHTGLYSSHAPSCAQSAVEKQKRAAVKSYKRLS